jgi:hypothetical protein
MIDSAVDEFKNQIENGISIEKDNILKSLPFCIATQKDSEEFEKLYYNITNDQKLSDSFKKFATVCKEVYDEFSLLSAKILLEKSYNQALQQVRIKEIQKEKSKTIFISPHSEENESKIKELDFFMNADERLSQDTSQKSSKKILY